MAEIQVLTFVRSEKGVVEGFMKSFTTTIKTKSQDLKSKVSKFMDSEQGIRPRRPANKIS